MSEAEVKQLQEENAKLKNQVTELTAALGSRSIIDKFF